MKHFNAWDKVFVSEEKSTGYTPQEYIIVSEVEGKGFDYYQVRTCTTMYRADFYEFPTDRIHYSFSDCQKQCDELNKKPIEITENNYCASSFIRVLTTLQASQLYVVFTESKKVICVPMSQISGINAEFGEYCDLTIEGIGIVPIECVFTSLLTARVFARNFKNIRLIRMQPVEYSSSEIEFCGTGYTNRDDDDDYDDADFQNRGGTYKG